MMNTVHQDYFANRKFRLAWLLLVVGLSLGNWVYLALSRQWNGMMGPYSHAYVILFLLAYPLPCLHLLKKEPNPFVIAILMYLLLGLAGSILFPLVR